MDNFKIEKDQDTLIEQSNNLIKQSVGQLCHISTHVFIYIQLFKQFKKYIGIQITEGLLYMYLCIVIYYVEKLI